MRDQLGAAALTVAALLLGACGQGSDDTAAPDGRSCSEVAELEEARRVVGETFGSGVEGREAQRTIVEAIEARPDCFSGEEVEFARGMRDLLPSSDAEADALRTAEEACGADFGSWAVQGPDDPAHGSAEEALAEDDATLPDGEPERSFQEGGRVGFDYRDGGAYRGWVLVAQADDGWFVKRVITCGGEEAIPKAK